VPFGDPQKMLDRIFGTDPEAEKQALERIDEDRVVPNRCPSGDEFPCSG